MVRETASEALFAEFFSVIPWIPAMVLVTYRPEYRGVLTQTPGSQTISLAPLSDSQTAVLAGEMLGAHPSVKRLVRQVAERAVGNPFFAEEIVRDHIFSSLNVFLLTNYVFLRPAESVLGCENRAPRGHGRGYSQAEDGWADGSSYGYHRPQFQVPDLR